ncbi:hypothetical protein F4810DRAFT_679536 [Camillea tinctor]|nr:hypothetical protein F4810DRAFT_679536 [Camillea tinctor]
MEGLCAPASAGLLCFAFAYCITNVTAHSQVKKKRDIHNNHGDTRGHSTMRISLKLKAKVRSWFEAYKNRYCKSQVFAGAGGDLR